MIETRIDPWCLKAYDPAQTIGSASANANDTNGRARTAQIAATDWRPHWVIVAAAGITGLPTHRVRVLRNAGTLMMLVCGLAGALAPIPDPEAS
jgi:hypothetical protein